MHSRKAAVLATILVAGWAMTAGGDGQYQNVPVTNNWTDIAAITVNDNWAGVVGFQGFLGDSAAGSPTGRDPRTEVLGNQVYAIDVNANQTDPNTFISGGVAEFHLANPTIALNGSGTADWPHLVLYCNTILKYSLTLSYNLIDIDGSVDNSVQPVVAQYRTSSTSDWTNLPATYIADATAGPSLSGQVTAVSTALPAACENANTLEIRVLTTNAVGNDEWVAIDDISLTAATNLPAAGPIGFVALGLLLAGSAAWMFRRRPAQARA